MLQSKLQICNLFYNYTLIFILIDFEFFKLQNFENVLFSKFQNLGNFWHFLNCKFFELSRLQFFLIFQIETFQNC